MNTSNRSETREGATLFVVMMLMFLCTMAVASVMFSVSAQMQRAAKQVQLEQAFYLAEAGAERASAWVGLGNEADETFTGNLGAGSYAATVSVAPLAGGEIGITVAATGTVGSVSRAIVMRGLRRVSWARFALWYDREALSLVMVPGEVFRGRVYSKPQLRFHHSGLAMHGPVQFYDRVWSVPTTIQVNTGADPVFHMGITLGAAEESMASVDLDALRATALTSGQGIVLDGNATIELDGTNMRVTNVAGGYDNDLVPLPADGIVYARAHTYTVTTPRYNWRGVQTGTTTTTVNEPGTINISGPSGLSGGLTIVSEDDINVIGHVRYADNPEVNPASTDRLGLIAKKNVVVQTSAPNNVEIYAHILCREGGFGVASYNTGSSRGILKVYGGIANLIRNAVGTTSPTGYLKNYIFDNRLNQNPPPYYPRLTNQLEWQGWEG